MKTNQKRQDQAVGISTAIAVIISLIIVSTNPGIDFDAGVLIVVGSAFLAGLLAGSLTGSGEDQ